MTTNVVFFLNLSVREKLSSVANSVNFLCLFYSFKKHFWLGSFRELFSQSKMAAFRVNFYITIRFCLHKYLNCYERDFMKSLSRENQADIIEALW